MNTHTTLYVVIRHFDNGAAPMEFDAVQGFYSSLDSAERVQANVESEQRYICTIEPVILDAGVNS